MKLVYAIVNNDDTYAVSKGLLKNGIRGNKAFVNRRVSYVGKHHVYDML